MKILFISHQASHTGAPIALLTFLRWLKNTRQHKIRIIILKGGELSGEFRHCGKTRVLERKRKGKFEMMMLGLDDLFPHIRQWINGLKLRFITLFGSPDVIYLNSAASLTALPYIWGIRKTAVLCHVHEMEYALSSIMPKEIFISSCRNIRRFLVPSRAAAENLAVNYSVDANIVDVVPGPVSLAQPILSKKNIREELKTGDDTFIVMGAGLIAWPKAPEIFIMIAREVAALTSRSFQFIWLGELYPPYYKGLAYDISKMDLADKVNFIGQVNNPIDYFQAADVFLLTSREESFGLVCIEAASQCKPVICFEGVGGMTDFVKDDAGFIVPYLDIKTAAEKIVELINNPELKEKLGKTGKKRVHEESDINITGPKIIKIIENLITKEKE
ncbi:MAG: glycosyltransferase family 4 protein [Bacteroidales bacterium]|jgi:glycosyltransferase involved in cell wall biosynthesis|nr:glycosyltransferase family 4 protein [Bacteroidales bacterium]